MKIGIMGGTFDPIHNGHVMLGEYAKDLFALDEIWFMPNGNPPHKMNEKIESQTKHRVEMVRRAIADKDGFVLQLYEVERKDVNYSYLTMQHFKEVYPECEFYFIIGADSLFALESWVHPEKLVKTCVILAAYRDDKDTDEMMTQISYLNQKYGADIRLLKTPNVDISSTEIRHRIKYGLSVDDMIPESVYKYIQEHHLFADDLEEMKEKVRKSQKESRFSHTLGVVETAIQLAKQYQVDVKKAEIAALLHDCAKGFGGQEQLRLCQKYGLTITEAEERNPFLLHAKLGAYLAKTDYGIDDEEILDAIRWHTTGRPEMTQLDKIIYIADYIEPNRNQAPNLDEIRHLARVNLDECLYTILKATLAYLETKKDVIDPMTEQTYLYYKKYLNK